MLRLISAHLLLVLTLAASTTVSAQQFNSADGTTRSSTDSAFRLYWDNATDTLKFQCATSNTAGTTITWADGPYLDTACTMTGAGGGGSSSIDALTDAVYDLPGDNMRIGSNTAMFVGAERNLFIGEGAGSAGTNNQADSNIAIGYQSLNDLTTGGGNVAIGYNTLTANTVGWGNVAIGESVLETSIAGTRNVVVGTGAGQSLGSSSNVAIGYGALATSSNGHNVAIGDSALAVAVDGGNVAVGSGALILTANGYGNVGVGRSALSGNVSGLYNIALGENAGDNITTGDSNIIFGYDIDAPSATGDQQLNIGNTIYGDMATDKIGIGIVPLEALHVDGNIKVTVSGAARALLTSADGNTDFTLNDGAQNAQILLETSGSSYFTGGNVGIGLTSPGIKLSVGNGSTSAGAVGIYEDSDNGSNYASFTVPALAANTVYTLPPDDGDAGEQLQTNGGGTLTWESAGSGGGGGSDAGWMGATVATSQTRNVSSYADLATAGPAVTITTGSTAIVTLTASMANSTAANGCKMGFQVSGASTIAASDTQALWATTAANYVYQSSGTFYVTGLTPGSNTFTAKYSRHGGAGTCTFINRNIVVNTGILSVYGDGAPPVFSPDAGYFVLTAGTWNGDLGNFAGANAKCLTDLTNNDWMGKSDATTRGLIDSTHVKAFIMDWSVGNNTVPTTEYCFAVSGDDTKGGACFTTNAGGTGPNNYNFWSGTNYFDGAKTYWTGRWNNGSNSYWQNAGNSACDSWTGGTSAHAGTTGTSNSDAEDRIDLSNSPCDLTHHLICMVHP